jgi:hypothetical protein
VLITLITTPPNYQWQAYLKSKFQSNIRENDQILSYEKKEKTDDNPMSNSNFKPKQKPGKLHVRNTASKFTLDMTLSAMVNTAVFITLVSELKGLGVNQISAKVQEVKLSSPFRELRFALIIHV